MTQEISSLMDGELEDEQAERAIRGCCGNAESRRTWQAYHLIGDALRGDAPRRASSTVRILEALEREPTVLAPRRLRAASAGRIAFAAAASVATVAVVGWIGLQERAPASGPVVARQAPAAPVAPAVVPVANVNEYLALHRQAPNADYYRPVSNQATVAR